jgi:hypothetical protein
MKGVITIFAMPQEIEDLTLTLYNLKVNSIFIIDQDINYKVDVTMCLSNELTDWENSTLTKEYIKDRTEELCKKYLDWCEYELVIENGNKILGCVSQRRNSWLKNPDAEFFIWLDTDILFKDITLFYMNETLKRLKSDNFDMFVITPEFVKQWDNTWDIIVNKNYWNMPLDYYKNNNVFADCLTQFEDVNVKKIETFKFAGGWFTLISKPLLDKVSVPESFGHYGLEDTFIMVCSSFMVNKGIEVNQFIIENLICGENHKNRTNESIKKYISSKDRKEEFRKIAESNWDKEISLFNNKI